MREQVPGGSTWLRSTWNSAAPSKRSWRSFTRTTTSCTSRAPRTATTGSAANVRAKCGSAAKASGRSAGTTTVLSTSTHPTHRKSSPDWCATNCATSSVAGPTARPATFTIATTSQLSSKVTALKILITRIINDFLKNWEILRNFDFKLDKKWLFWNFTNSWLKLRKCLKQNRLLDFCLLNLDVKLITFYIRTNFWLILTLEETKI